MHELSIAMGVIEQVEQQLQLADAGGGKVLSITILVGEFSLVDKEALTGAFELAAEGSVASGARLVIEEAKAVAACRHCAERFHPDIADFRCPKCGMAAADIVTGKELNLVSIEVDD